MNNVDDSRLALLKKTQSVIEIERALTETLERVQPWLRSSVPQPNRPRIRPIPATMDEATQILAVARNLASRTSAPAGWNPNAPVVGFSTPSPLPHQLRGGALAALQLERARQAERDRKRKRLQQQQQEQEEQKQQQLATTTEKDVSMEVVEEEKDPKRREVQQHEHELDRSKSDLARPSRPVQQQQQQQRPAMDVSMNLSDSSSDDDED